MYSTAQYQYTTITYVPKYKTLVNKYTKTRLYTPDSEKKKLRHLKNRNGKVQNTVLFRGDRFVDRI